MAGIQNQWQTTPKQKDLNSNQMDIYEIVDCAYEAGELWVDAASLHQRYKEGEKNKLAKLKNMARQLPLPEGKKVWTQGEIEDTAYAHPDWDKYLDEWNKAYEAMLKTRNNYDAWINKLEASRSKMATDRLLHKVM